MVSIVFRIWRWKWNELPLIEDQIKSAILRANAVNLLRYFYQTQYQLAYNVEQPHESVDITLDLSSIQEFIAAGSMLKAMIKAEQIEEAEILQLGTKLSTVQINELSRLGNNLNLVLT